MTVSPHDVRLDVRGVGHGAQVLHPHRRALRRRLHDHVVDRLDRLELIVREHVVVEVAGLEVAGREDQVRRLDRLDDVQDREPPPLQHRRVQIDVDLADLAAFDRRRGDIRQLLDLWGDGVEREVVESALVKVAAGDGHERGRDVRHVELDDEGLENAGGQLVQDLGDALHHFHLAHVDVGAPVEPHLDRPDALLGE